MIRFSVLICLAVLLFSTSAKPYRLRENVMGEAALDTMEFDFDEKMMQGIKEVEPPQDMDIADFDIDHNMVIWKAVKDQIQQKYNRPEEDKDAIYHPFDLKLPADSKHPVPFIYQQGNDQVQMYDEPEEDKDDLYHGMFNDGSLEDLVGQDLHHAVRGQQPVQPVHRYTEPEIDMDGLYHQ